MRRDCVIKFMNSFVNGLFSFHDLYHDTQNGLVVKAHRLVYHSILGWRVKKKKREGAMQKEEVLRMGVGALHKRESLLNL